MLNNNVPKKLQTLAIKKNKVRKNSQAYLSFYKCLPGQVQGEGEYIPYSDSGRENVHIW